uniref:Uncharacterized protein n=1 Tax=Palpitomonas bilix TaxID=652834 RepID=A0A7S3GB78_9EUKA|mmetsp:Transcript_43324/g.112651  ORF Transcript_43324/g.112651 Transcript_43324/m.112651 type:complete len:618 (+) Transcript_43324:284-2137(+)
MFSQGDKIRGAKTCRCLASRNGRRKSPLYCCLTICTLIAVMIIGVWQDLNGAARFGIGVISALNNLVQRDDPLFTRIMTDPHIISSALQVDGDRLDRLSIAINSAKAEKRPLRIGITGGSFSAGAGVGPFLSRSYPAVLEEISNQKRDGQEEVFPFGVEVVNIAQGAAGILLPFHCLDDLLLLISGGDTRKIEDKDRGGEQRGEDTVRGDALPPPDVWVVEFVENLDANRDDLAVYVTSLMHDQKRGNGGDAAVIIVNVVAGNCFEFDRNGEGGEDRLICKETTSEALLEEVASHLHLPFFSFAGAAEIVTHSRREGRGEATHASERQYDPALSPSLPPLVTSKTKEDENERPGRHYTVADFHRLVYVDGDKYHFNRYGHLMTATAVMRVLELASTHSPLPACFEKEDGEREGEEVKAGREPCASDQRSSRKGSDLLLHAISKEASAKYERLFERGSASTLKCYLTLTQGKEMTLVPDELDGFALWEEKTRPDTGVFNTRTRSDKKRTWASSREGASISFPIEIPADITTVCLLQYGGHNFELSLIVDPPPGEAIQDVPALCRFKMEFPWANHATFRWYGTLCDCTIPRSISSSAGVHKFVVVASNMTSQLAGIMFE